ncbi:DUF4292 domain-containing protein [Pedobacter endophyticus]|uniref:DUF4292 domain-containing protein n=1 Tax=Pedobacter endophyticus TaxID=2789740 RepID=A0A7U3Q4M8_9SPHI|nr:DUF4292 domain-containing protein [Pedobacter endophyticus]QPH38387.1 DUF4292 domain-containing protein [Pedobacter endophyticus]
MRRNILNSAALLAAIVFVSSCTPKKQIVVAPPVATTETAVDNSKAEALTLLNNKQLKINTLSLKAKATLDIAGNTNDVTMNFRMKDKEVIWVSITALGGAFEPARALITPDSIKIMNRQKSQLIAKPFSYIYNFTNRQVNFNTLQSILTGNAMGEFLTSESTVKQENGVWVVSGRKQDLDYRLLFNTLFKVAETNLNDAKNGQALKVTYTDYQKLNEYLFPTALQINTLSGNKKINIDLQFVKIDGNVPVDFPFKVPKSYTLVN